MEKYIWILLLFIAIAVAIVVQLLSKEKKNFYRKKEYLLNVPERKFFEALQKLLPSEYICFPQMVLNNIIAVKRGEDKKDYWKYKNKINKKTIDFVIFTKKHLQPVLAIEYDGWYHTRSDRRARDEFVNNAIKSSGLDIVHIKHDKNIDLEKIIKTEVISKIK